MHTRQRRRLELRTLEAKVADLRQTIHDLEERSGELALRAAVVSIVERAAAEANAHLARFGAPPWLVGPGADGPGARAAWAAPTPLEQSLDFLRPGRSLLGLEGCARACASPVCV
jgi:anti-sigma factor RsiW